jgi:SAM-dependent methyltransferase
LRLFGWWWWRSPNRPWLDDRSYVDLLESLPAGSTGLDLGSRQRVRPDAITLDIEEGPDVDVVGDGHYLPFPDETFDYVWSNAVLEHVRDPARVAAEIGRVLKPGGLAIVNVPFLENVHNWPDDYYRYTPNGLRVLFRDLEEVRSGISAGPGQVLPDLLQYYATGFSELQQGRLLPNLVTVAVGTVLLPWRVLDRVLHHRPTYWRWARSFYFIGRKPDEPVSGDAIVSPPRARVVFITPDDGGGFEEVMSERTGEMVAALRTANVEVLELPVGEAAGGPMPPGMGAARIVPLYRADAFLAPNMNYFLEAVAPASSVLAKSPVPAVLLWDDPLGALALWQLGRRGIRMGWLGEAGEEDPVALFEVAMRRGDARHFSWDSGHIAAVTGLGLIERDSVEWYPIATYEPFLAQGRRGPPEERFDVTFCGNVYPSAVEQSNFADDEIFVSLTDRICAAKCANLELPVWDLLQSEVAALSAADRHGHGLDVHSSAFWDYYVYLVWMAATTRARLGVLGAIEREVNIFGVFGDPSSVDLLGRTPNLVYRGVAHHTRELPAVFASTRVNVCPSNCLIHSGVPSKFVDCVASGGFALVDPKPDLVTLFGREVEAVFFRNGDELNAKVEYFLERPDERREIVETLRSRIEEECTLAGMFERVLAGVERPY